MSNNNNNNSNNNHNAPDATGDIISWVITFVLMFAFPPVGILMLIMKLRKSANSAASAARWEEAKAAGAARVEAARQRSAQSADTSRQYTGSVESAARQVAQDVGAAWRQAAQEAGPAARQAAQEAGSAIRKAAQEVESAWRQAAQGTGQAAGQAQQGTGPASQQAQQGAQQTQQSQQTQQGTQQAAQGAQQTYQQAAQGARPTYQQAAQGYGGAAKHGAQESQTGYTWDYGAHQKNKKNKAKNRSQLDKKSGKFLSALLVIASIAMLALGGSGLVDAARAFFGGLDPNWFSIVMSSFLVIGAFTAFFSRNIGKRRFGRYKRYYAFTMGHGIVSIPDIARAAGLPARVVKRDIQAMINAGYFDAGTYIDNELDSLVLSPEAAEEARKATRAAYEPEPQTAETPENQYMAIIYELREIKSTIADVAISGKVDRIEELTGKIFRIVEEKPEKQSQIRRFTSYYLPTTMKLLRSYSTLEKQGIKGENITAAKENIGRILDTLATGYEQQLDQLFQADAMDIAADIDVLENLMQQDGLSGEKSEFRMMAGSSN